MRVALLSTTDSRILGYIIEAFDCYGVEIFAVLFDEKGVPEKNKQLFEDRTGGRIPFIPFSRFSDRIPSQSFSSHASEECIRWIRKNEIDILVNAGTPRILPASVIDAAKLGVLNCHPGILPDYRGCSCVEWALWNGDPVGNTVHLMTEEIDRGKILKKAAIRIDPGDAYQDIRTKVYLGGFDLLARTVREWRDGVITEAQFEEGAAGTYYKPMPDEIFQKLLKRLDSDRVSR